MSCCIFICATETTSGCDGSLLCCGVWKQEMSATKGEKWRKGSVKNCTILSLCPVQRGMTFPQPYWPPKMWQHKVILWKGKWLTIAFCGLRRPLFWWAGTNLSKERSLFFKDRNVVIFQRWKTEDFFFRNEVLNPLGCAWPYSEGIIVLRNICSASLRGITS